MASLASLLEEDPGLLEAVDTSGLRPLHLAVLSGRVGAVRAVAGAGAGLGARDGQGRTPLHWAVACGEEGMVEELLGRGAEVEAEDRWRTSILLRTRLGGRPLHYAATRQQGEALAARLLKVSRLVLQERRPKHHKGDLLHRARRGLTCEPGTVEGGLQPTGPPGQVGGGGGGARQDQRAEEAAGGGPGAGGWPLHLHHHHPGELGGQGAPHPSPLCSCQRAPWGTLLPPHPPPPPGASSILEFA